MSHLEEVRTTPKQFRTWIFELLEKGKKREAAELLWPQIVQNEQSLKIWDAIENNTHLCIMGHASASKTFTCAQWFLLDWWSRPTETAVIITSDTIGSMKRRIWSDLKMLWSSAKVKMPGILVDSKTIIQYSPIDQKHAIAAVAAEAKEATSKIQGVHSKFIRVLIDEADNKLSNSVWAAIPNLETSGEDFKCVALANPFDKSGEFAERCKPKDGWDSLNPEVDMEWKGQSGWHVLRLDGLQSPNIASGEDKYPFLLTNKGLASIREKEGEHSPQWWAYIRAFYPPEGSIHSIFTPSILKSATGKHLWYAEATPCAAADPAFEGGDQFALGFGHYGRLAENPLKMGVQLEETVFLKRKHMEMEHTIDLAFQTVEHLKARGIKASDFCIDATGMALGVADHVKYLHGKEVLAVQFGGSPTEYRVTQQDSLLPKDRYDRFVTELWYVGREWCKLGLAKIVNPSGDLLEQLENRLYSLIGKDKVRAETKKEMKGRGLQSPDEGDMLNLLIHLVRIRSLGIVPSIGQPMAPKIDADPFKRFRKLQGSLQPTYGVPSP